jgi:hypothetical protein
MLHTYQELRENPLLWEQTRGGKIELRCEFCGCVFWRTRSSIYTKVTKHTGKTFCSNECYNQFVSSTVESFCVQCGNAFPRMLCRIKGNRQSKTTKSDHIFCSKSCAATYNNLHKTHGTRRSKLEVWLEERLRELYPDLEILFNAKEAINAELDIHFPSLNLAFELNGIYHYEPIHGEEKLASIQTNDHRKFAACSEKRIALCVIDVSAMKNFKTAKGQKFLDIIVGIVEQKSGRASEGVCEVAQRRI